MNRNDTRQGGLPDPGQPDDSIDILDLAAALWGGKLWILLTATLALAVGAFLTLRVEPQFQATGLLQLEARSGALGLPEGLQDLVGSATGSNVSPSDTEVEILKSRMIMAQVVQELDLQIHAAPRPLPILRQLPRRLHLPDPALDVLKAYQWGDDGISIGELNLPDGLLGKDLVLRITGPGLYALTLPDGSRHEGRLHQRLSLPDVGLTLVVDRISGPEGREFLIGRRTLAEAVDLVLESFDVAENPKRSSMLRASLTDADPRRAEAILNAIMRVYVGQDVARGTAEAQSSLAFIDQQLPVSKQAVTNAQDALNAYRTSHSSIDVDYESRSLLERATKIEADLNALALQEADLKKRYTINHPAYQALLENRAALNRQLEESRAAASNLPETQQEIFNLTRDLDVAQAIYVQLLNRAQALQVVRASTVGSVRIIDTAYSDGLPVSPRMGRTLGISLLAGVILGIGLVLLRRALRRGVQGAEEIEEAGLPVFATVNFSAFAANLAKRKGNLPIMAQAKPNDLAVEALRSLRTSLHFGMLDARTKTVLFTSATPGAGKSFISVNLAAVAAQAGQKVCLVDADLRKGYLRRFAGKERGTPGLAELLAGLTTLDEVLVSTPVEGLSLLTSGRYPPNPSELLMRPAFDGLLQELNGRFDLIIVDSPPVLAVTDPVMISRRVGATILVTKHLETMSEEIQAVRRSFETVGSKLTGAILNGYKPTAGGKYGNRYHYYNYRYHYKSDRS